MCRKAVTCCCVTDVLFWKLPTVFSKLPAVCGDVVMAVQDMLSRFSGRWELSAVRDSASGRVTTSSVLTQDVLPKGERPTSSVLTQDVNDTPGEGRSD